MNSKKKSRMRLKMSKTDKLMKDLKVEENNKLRNFLTNLCKK